MKFFEVKNGELDEELIKLLEDEEIDDSRVEQAILEMKGEIRARGFEAIAEYTRRFDNFELTEENFMVSREEIDALAAKVDPKISKALEVAVERIKAFHEQQKEQPFTYTDSDGNKMGQNVVPLEAAAVYVPGGDALYPSTFYMCVVPALIAGVKRIVVLTPPRTFLESPEAARLIQILGIEEIYRGAGAALVLGAVYGAGKLKPVDKIVGPGNSYVSKAKQLCYGKIDIDMIAGPSDILVIADTDKEEEIPLIASDLLSQAEHGPAGENKSVLVGFNKEYLLKIEEELYRQARALPDPQAVARSVESLDQKGIIVLCKDRWEAVEASNKLAPEHLELFSDDPYSLLERVKYAGSVFLGKNTPESVGDYLGGPNHVLPTSGTARFYSPLGVYDFQKRLSWIEFTEKSLSKYGDSITTIARAETLEAHARSVETRFK